MKQKNITPILIINIIHLNYAASALANSVKKPLKGYEK